MEVVKITPKITPKVTPQGTPKGSPRTRRMLANTYIKREGVYHASSPPFAYPYHQKFLHLRLRSKKNNLCRVDLIFGDGYQLMDGKWVYQTQQMQLEGQDHLFDFWFIQVEPKWKRCRYFFKLTTSTAANVQFAHENVENLENRDHHNFFDKFLHEDSEEIGISSPQKLQKFTSAVAESLHLDTSGKTPFYEEYYGERGFNSDFERALKCGFDFPFVHSVDIFNPPEWSKNAIWYQIFPERFANGDASTNPENAEPWGNNPTEYNYFGGDFQGIIDRVPHLVELGITALYLTPIFKAESNHKYNTTDYFEVDPQFGNKETLRELIKVLHDNGIKIIFDAVFNHTGDKFEPFLNLLKEQEKSPYKDWFFVRSFPISYDPIPSYDCFGFHAYMPKLNTANPEVKNFIFSVIKYWTVEFGIDGWRLDVSNEIDHVFWREFRVLLKSLNPNAFIIGEVWYNSSRWLLGDQFDSVMNYPLHKSVLDFFCNNSIGAVEFCEHLTTCRYWYPENVNEVLFNILSSHDTARILTLCNGNIDLIKTVYMFHIFSTGTPCIYYGDEVGMTGENDPDCRKCMEWDVAKQDRNLFSHIKKLITIRKENKDFFVGKAFEIVYSSPDHNYCLFARTYGQKKLFAIINNDDSELDFNEDTFPWFFNEHSLFSKKQAVDLISEKNINSLTTVQPFESFVFIVE